MKNSRRHFLVTTLKALALAPIAAMGTNRLLAEEKKKSANKSKNKATSSLPLADPEKTPQAKALKYVHDAAKAPAALRKAKPGTCANCQFYTAIDKSKGKCTMIPGHAVKATGWCSVWTKKM